MRSVVTVSDLQAIYRYAIPRHTLLRVIARTALQTEKVGPALVLDSRDLPRLTETLLAKHYITPEQAQPVLEAMEAVA